MFGTPCVTVMLRVGGLSSTDDTEKLSNANPAPLVLLPNKEIRMEWMSANPRRKLHGVARPLPELKLLAERRFVATLTLFEFRASSSQTSVPLLSLARSIITP